MTARSIASIDLGNCELNNVLYIPDLRRNLLSVSSITKKEEKIEFYKDIVTISKDKRIIFEGKKIVLDCTLFKIISLQRK